MLVAVLSLSASATAQETNPIPGRPWSYMIPDPDKFDWSKNDRPGYHFAGMSPNQKRFYDYIQAKKQAGQALSTVDESMIRRLTASRAWPEAPRPNQFWKAYMRYLREQTNDDLNTAQRIMLSQLLARGIGGFDNTGDDNTRRLAEYLNSRPFEARNWFERTFGRVEPWLKYEYQTMSYAPAGATPGNVFPPDHFNGLQITYNVSGATLGKVTESGSFTWIRSIEGTFRTGGTLNVSGTVRVGGFGADIMVYVYAGSKNDTYKIYIENKPGKNTGAYNVSVPIPKDAENAGFTVREDGRYSMGGGHRGLVVTASLSLDPSEKAAKQAVADEEWRKHVEDTLARLGYQNTPEGQEVEAMRKALAGGQGAWGSYVDDQQKKLGYDSSPEGRAYADLDGAIKQGGEPFNAFVRKEMGDKAPGWAQTALPDVGGISVGPSVGDGKVEGASDRLSGVTKLATAYAYEGVPENSQFEAVWTRDGTEISRSKRQTGGDGWVSFSVSTSSGTMKPGRYTVTILVNGVVAARKTVTVT